MYASSLVLGIFLLGGALAFPVERNSSVHCSIIPLNNAQSLYFSLSKGQPEQAVSSLGIRSNYTLSKALHAVGSHASPGNNPLVLVSSHPVPGYHFGFEACTSTHMNYPSYSASGSPHWYGHIRVYNPHGGANDSALCVTKRWVEPGHEFLSAEACSYDDNSSQECQFFTVQQLSGKSKTGKYSLGMIGAPKGKWSKHYYFQPGTTKAPAVTVHPDYETGYRLGIEHRGK
ncbi:hypothetical protein BS47DRAFT_1368871 [Hydnum rufescens UP504]|uniref:Uncharacterized protein n=1 Tax=Hydnum rufescens UP504 TaxID=1448309 RepID=A0A9P6AG60_9AGAM|nr:hypothetical protein BS47DRAFT_1368871 [Hydnum rufescens UP504]